MSATATKALIDTLAMATATMCERGNSAGGAVSTCIRCRKAPQQRIQLCLRCWSLTVYGEPDR